MTSTSTRAGEPSSAPSVPATASGVVWLRMPAPRCTASAHDLRNPLHAILGFAELLDTPDRDAASRRALGHIRASAHDLLGVVEQMLAQSGDQTPIE